MAEQRSNPLFQALQTHGTHFFLFLIIFADGLATSLGFYYGATVCAWVLSFLFWLIAYADFYVHRDLLATIVVILLMITLAYGLIYRLFTESWKKPRAHMLSIAIVLILLWFVLEVCGLTLGHSSTFVTWIPPLELMPFPNPFSLWPVHLWPLWQWTGCTWAAGYLYFAHRKRRSPRPDVNVRKVRIRIQEPEPEPSVKSFHPNTNETGRRAYFNNIVDAVPTPKPATREPQYREEARVFPLSVIHEHSEPWNILEQRYQNYRAALKRFRISPVRRLSIPPQALSYSSKGLIGWHKHKPVLPETLFRLERRKLLSGYYAHEVAFFQGVDLWVRDLLTYYPNEVTRGSCMLLLLGYGLVIPTWIKVHYQRGWEYDRTKDADVFAYFVGEGPNLKGLFEQLQADDRNMPSSATLDPEHPTLAERIGQLDGLMNQENEQMRSYGLVPPDELPLVEQQRLKNKRTRQPPSPN